MKTAAIIAEYNPFHLGHAYQLSKIKADFVIAIMSGNFVQRGEPAVFDKWLRTEAALSAGIDLVLELPVSAAAASAEYFAAEAVFLLEQSQVVDALYFGAECPDLPPLQALAEILTAESTDFSAALKSSLKSGRSYAAARQEAVENLFPDAGYGRILKGSNNILAIEYLKALTAFRSQITPHLIQRQGQSYLDENYQPNTFLSATAIRRLLRENDRTNLSTALPAASFQLLQAAEAQKNGPIFPEDIYPFVQFLLIQQDSAALLRLREQKPELINRLLAALDLDLPFAGYISACRSRNFPAAAVKRALLNIFLNQRPSLPPTEENSYLRILGLRRSAAPLLRRLQKVSRLPVITNTRHAKKLPAAALARWQNELHCDRLYARLTAQKYGRPFLPPEQRNPVVI